MSDCTKTCKDCKLIKVESDFPKGKGVCKACISNKIKENNKIKEINASQLRLSNKIKEINENEETNENTENKDTKIQRKTSPSKEDQKFNLKKEKIIKDFEKMINELTIDAENNKEILTFIGKLTIFANNI